MKKRRKPRDEAVEVGEQTTKHRRKDAKFYLKLFVCGAFGSLVFRCTTSFGTGLLLFALFLLNDVLAAVTFMDEAGETDF